MKIRGLALDWDGVWTNGRKRHDGQSDFSEHDTMGINLLRFAHFDQTGEVLRIALITGERNPTAEHVVQREHFDHFLYYARDKTKAIPILEQAWGIKSADWGFVFDDVLDLELAAKVGRRAMVQWPATQAIQDIAAREGLIDDWIPADSPIRHFCERYLNEQGWLEGAVADRRSWSANYQAYWAMRNAISPQIIDLSPL